MPILSYLSNLGMGGGGGVPASLPLPTGSGGGTSRSFGYYPEVNREIVAYKNKIERTVKKRKQVEQRMSFALNASDLQRLLAQVNSIQRQIDAMVENYERMLAAFRKRSQIIEDEGLLLSLIV